MNLDDDIKEYEISPEKYITGTLMWYYSICKREVWLIARELAPEQENPLLDFGKALHETSYSNFSTKELGFEGVKFDIYIKGKKMICEVKTSSKYLDAARLQVKYYLYRLRELGVDTYGMVVVPRERKRYSIRLNEEDVKELNRIFQDIKDIVNRDVPPPPKKIPFCRRCAYRDFCWV